MLRGRGPERQALGPPAGRAWHAEDAAGGQDGKTRRNCRSTNAPSGARKRRYAATKRRPSGVRRRLDRGPDALCSRNAKPAASSSSRSRPHAYRYDIPMLRAARRSDPRRSTVSSRSAFPSPKSVRGPSVSQNFALVPRRAGAGGRVFAGIRRAVRRDVEDIVPLAYPSSTATERPAAGWLYTPFAPASAAESVRASSPCRLLEGVPPAAL